MSTSAKPLSRTFSSRSRNQTGTGSATPPTISECSRQQLREALRSAVDGEQRFGLREDARAELDQRWDRVIDLMVELCQRPKK